jgi:hypothetical protein
MNRWIRRLLMLLVVLVWLGIILLPTVAFVLARNNQIQLGDTGGPHWRLFLLQEAQTEGLGLERAQTVTPPPDAPETAQCLRTTVSYWFWTGEGENAAYCQCVDETTGATLPITPPACLMP